MNGDTHQTIPSGVPDPKDEMEAKYKVGSLDDLRRIREDIVKNQRHSALYSSLLKHGYLTRDGVDAHLKGRPVSWYVDDKNRSLSNKDKTIRSRFSLVNGVLLPEVQHCVKGDAIAFSGSSGTVRLEDEVKNENKRFSPEFFSDPRTVAMLEAVKPEDFHLHFATDVKRHILGIVDTNHGQRSLFEIAFDHSRYIAPDGRGHNRKFHEQYEIEIEYVHPLKKSGELGRIAQQMDLSILTTPEVDAAMARIARSVQKTAKKLEISMKPEAISKGKRGFIELEAQGGSSSPIALYSDDALVYLPH